MTAMVALPIPVGFAASAVMSLLPGWSGTAAVQSPDPGSTVAATPFTVTAAPGSSTVPLMVTGLATTTARSAGVVMVTAGAGIAAEMVSARGALDFRPSFTTRDTT
jgi:hypothetical protein